MAKTISTDRAQEQQAPAAKVFGPLTRIFNPLAMRFAGSAHVPLWAIIRHRGRRSGRVYATPVAIGHTPDALVVPLPFGPDVDWCRNVRSAGGCVVRWKSQEHRMIDPEIVEDAGAAFAVWERPALRALGIKRFLRLRFESAAA